MNSAWAGGVMNDSAHELKRQSSVTCAVVTVSDTRTRETDKGGSLIVERLQTAGHRILSYEIIPDDSALIRSHVLSHCGPKCDAIILTGGTGIAPRDVTCEALLPLIEKRLEGFAELFRMLSFEEIGPSAMLSRTLAGTCGKTLIFSLPGSPKAVELAMDRLILPVLPHATSLLQS
jgi:molybdenum cofactor biosynthesis protein B